MKIHRVLVQADGNRHQVGNSFSWRYCANKEKIDFSNVKNPRLDFSANGNYDGKTIVFDTSKDGRDRFCGEVKLPKNPIRRAMWNMGFSRRHEITAENFDGDFFKWSSEDEEIYHEAALNGRVKFIRIPAEGKIRLSAQAGRSFVINKLYWNWYADWASVTMKDVEELAWALGEEYAEALGLERTNQCTCSKVFEACNFDCQNCEFGAHSAPYERDWQWQLNLKPFGFWHCNGGFIHGYKNTRCKGDCRKCVFHNGEPDGIFACEYDRKQMETRKNHRVYDSEYDKKLAEFYETLDESSKSFLKREELEALMGKAIGEKILKELAEEEMEEKTNGNI